MAEASSSSAQAASAGKKRSIDDFEVAQTLGEGAYGAVMLATDKSSNKEMAIKMIDKAHIKKEKKEAYVTTERDILTKCDSPWIIKLYYTFQDSTYLYFCMELAPKGELLGAIKRSGGFSIKTTAHYAAELILALEYLHTKANVVHRDMKPENLLLSAEGHLKVTDFGTAKDVGPGRDARSNSFVGTAEYISPELLNDKACYKASDLWALGCIIYQMLCNRPPFRGLSEYLTFQKVTAGLVVYPKSFPEVAKDLIGKLLVRDPFQRLGANDYAELKAHPFFAYIKWEEILSKPAPPIEKPLEPWVWQEDIIREEEERKRVKKEEERKEWEQFLLEKEQIVESGLIYKRRKLSIKKRMLILTDTPRVFYIDPRRRILKGEVPWSSKLYVEIKNDVVWRINTPKRIYYLEDLKKNSQRWAEAIRKLQNDGK